MIRDILTIAIEEKIASKETDLKLITERSDDRYFRDSLQVYSQRRRPINQLARIYHSVGTININPS